MTDAAPIELSGLTDDLSRVLDCWRELGGETLGCSWQTFDLLSVPAPLVPTTMVIAAGPTMADNRYLFWGSGMTRIHGADMTGKCPYALSPPDLSDALRRQHADTMTTKAAGATLYTFIRPNGVEQRHMTLRVPLSSDGSRVDHIVAVMDPNADQYAA